MVALEVQASLHSKLARARMFRLQATVADAASGIVCNYMSILFIESRDAL